MFNIDFLNSIINIIVIGIKNVRIQIDIKY